MILLTPVRRVLTGLVLGAIAYPVKIPVKLLVMAPASMLVGGSIGVLAPVLVPAALAPDAQRVPRGLILRLAHRLAQTARQDSISLSRAKTTAIQLAPRERILRLVHRLA